MRRGDVVRVTDTRDHSVRIGQLCGSGDWGYRFRVVAENKAVAGKSFQVDEYTFGTFEFEVLDYPELADIGSFDIRRQDAKRRS